MIWRLPNFKHNIRINQRGIFPVGYHIREIKKGKLGESSKITEEYQEFLDALEQNNKVMALVELSDLLGAIEAYVAKYNLTLNDLIYMKNATRRAFESGHRT
jgi:phosphoribosyl-ATP pyrophosphohydrolase